MWINLLLLILLIHSGVYAENESKLVPPACYRDDPNFNNCLLKSAELLRPLLKEGVTELDLPSVSSFLIPKIKFEQSTSDANYVFLAKNVVLTGLDTYNFTSIKFDTDALKLVARFKIDLINMKGNFSTNGQILGISTEGDGPFSFNMTNLNGTIKQQLTLSTRNGVEYLEPLFDITKIDIGGFSYKYDGIHDNNALLKRTADRAIYDYETEWIPYYKTVIEEEIIKIISGVLLPNLYKIPFEKLFPIHH